MLRDDIANGTACQVAYARNGLREVRGLPWSLCRGDIRANLEALGSAPKPEEEVAGRIHDLLMAGISLESNVGVVRLLGQVPWTTTSVEDPHNAAQHHENTSDTLERH